jgi:hypothetical protein
LSTRTAALIALAELKLFLMAMRGNGTGSAVVD